MFFFCAWEPEPHLPEVGLPFGSGRRDDWMLEPWIMVDAGRYAQESLLAMAFNRTMNSRNAILMTDTQDVVRLS